MEIRDEMSRVQTGTAFCRRSLPEITKLEGKMRFLKKLTISSHRRYDDHTRSMLYFN